MPANFDVEIAAIDKAMEALTNLKTLLQSGAPPFLGFHDNPIDGTCYLRRSNQQELDDGTETAVTITIDPSDQDTPNSAKKILVEWYA